jgi:hypothetical protein
MLALGRVMRKLGRCLCLDDSFCPKRTATYEGHHKAEPPFLSNFSSLDRLDDLQIGSLMLRASPRESKDHSLMAALLCTSPKPFV